VSRGYRVALAAWLALVLVSCAEETPTGPDLSANQFIYAARRGDGKTLWALLDKESQQMLASYAGVRSGDPEGWARVFLFAPRFRWLADLSPVTEKDIVREGNKATVTVRSLADGTMTLQLVEEQGSWKIHLPPLGAASAPLLPGVSTQPASAPSSSPASSPAPASAPVPASALVPASPAPVPSPAKP
jgi:hypothetical protein